MGTPSCWPATQDDRQWMDAGQQPKTAMPPKRIKTPSVRFFCFARQFVPPCHQKRSSGRFCASWTYPATLPLPSCAHSGTEPSCWWLATVDGWPAPKPADRPFRHRLLAGGQCLPCEQTVAYHPLLACNGYPLTIAWVGEQTAGDGLLADGCRLMAGCEKKKKKKKKKRERGAGALAPTLTTWGAGAIFGKTRKFSPSPPHPPNPTHADYS